MAKYGSFLYGGALYGEDAPIGDPSGDPVGWGPTTGGNHGGDDWIITADTVIAGVHRNIGRFAIEADVIVRIAPYTGTTLGEIEVQAQDIDIAGALVASAAGYRGGAAGLAGEGPFGGGAGVNGGYLAAAGQGDVSIDPSGVKGSGGGGGPAQPGGSGGALMRLFARSRLRLQASGVLLAHGAVEGEAAAGHGAGGGIVLHCDGPFGLVLAGDVQTLGGGSLTANGGTLKEFALPGLLAVTGSTSAGREHQDATLRRAALLS